MASASHPDPGSDPQALVRWIDHAVGEHFPALDVAAVLTEYALPNHRGLTSPFVYGSEGWYWSWNRAGFAYIESGRYRDAAITFSCAYLAALRIQHDYQERFHKGMPLCNIAYSYLRANDAIKARVPAALGTIEDVTTFVDPTSTGNLSNLRATAYPESLTQGIIDYAREFYRSKGRFPLYPEVVLHSMRWNSVVDTKSCLLAMQGIAGGFASETIGSSLQALGLLWHQYSLSVPSVLPQGDAPHGRAEPTVRVGPSPLSGAASLSGSTIPGR